jgi:hypothetical protein
MDTPDSRDNCWMEAASGWAGKSTLTGAAWAAATVREKMATAMGRRGKEQRSCDMSVLQSKSGNAGMWEYLSLTEQHGGLLSGA